MTYETFQYGPEVYIPVLIVSLIITLIAYGTFPIVFAKTRKKSITKRKYKTLCYAVNFFVMVLFTISNGEPSSGAPYLLWTWVFSTSGINTLKNRKILKGSPNVDCKKTETHEKNNTSSFIDSNEIYANQIEPNESIRTITDISPKNSLANDSLDNQGNNNVQIGCNNFCRKCGEKLLEDSKFCHKCGTEIVDWGKQLGDCSKQ